MDEAIKCYGSSDILSKLKNLDSLFLCVIASTQTSRIPGITGAVTGETGEGNHTWLLVIGILILLAIGMAVVSLIRGNMYRKKMGYI